MAALGGDGIARAIWADQRSGNYDIYGQNLNGDGSLGPSAVPVPEDTPARIRLEQNHPNPFNPSTEIDFSLSRQQHVFLRVFDTKGRLVRTLLDEVAGPGAQFGALEWPGHRPAVKSRQVFISIGLILK